MGDNRRLIPKTLNQASAIRLLEAYGWTRGHGGKHDVKMERALMRPITLPGNRRKDYPPGLRNAILKQAGIK